jgi:hypothetical protein
MVHHILDSHPHGTERHLHGYFEGLDALTHHQGAYGFHKGMNHSGVFSSSRTYIHTESPPFLYETFGKRPLLPNVPPASPERAQARDGGQAASDSDFNPRNTYRVFLRLKSSPSLTLNKIERFSKVS